MIQLESKTKSLFIIIIIFLAILSNFYLFGGSIAQTSHLATDVWSQVINDISNQAIIVSDHRSEYSLLYKPFKLKFLDYRLFRFHYHVVRIFITRVPRILKSVGFFFLIYYQISRTSSDGSDPSNFNYQNLDN